MLPVYCTDCFDFLCENGSSDPTLDVGLIYFVWWGAHREGIPREEVERIISMS